MTAKRATSGGRWLADICRTHSNKSFRVPWSQLDVISSTSRRRHRSHHGHSNGSRSGSWSRLLRERERERERERKRERESRLSRYPVTKFGPILRAAKNHVILLITSSGSFGIDDVYCWVTRTSASPPASKFRRSGTDFVTFLSSEYVCRLIRTRRDSIIAQLTRRLHQLSLTYTSPIRRYELMPPGGL